MLTFATGRTVTADGPALPTSPTGDSILQLASVEGNETLSELYSYTLEMMTPPDLPMLDEVTANLDLKAMIGKRLTVTIQLDGMGSLLLRGLMAGFLVACIPAICFGAASSATPTSTVPVFSFFGTWRIDVLTGYSEISTNPDDLKKLVGRYVVVSPNRLKIADDDCRIIQLHESTRETTRLLLEGYRAGPEDAGVPLHTQVLQTELCGDVFRVGDDIVVNEGGAFFRASRVKPDGPRNRKP